MVYYTIYKVTNKITGKIYIGSHKTKDLNDNYMGSGKYLNRAFQKYGLENFTKEILFVFDNPTDMYAKEAEIVNEEFLAEENTYNLKRGGFGGFDYINNNKLQGFSNSEIAKKARKTVDSKLEIKYGQDWRRHISTLGRQALSNILEQDPDYLKNLAKLKDMSGANNPMYGKTHTQETRNIISLSNKGEKNPMFGKRWIHSITLKCSKRIDKAQELPRGWIEGRKIKFS